MFALLQEPYLGDDGMDVLPKGIRIFTDRRGKEAILVDHQDVICMPVDTLTTDFRVCLIVKGSFGSIFLCSAYCQFDAALEPYLRHMDAVQLQASRTPAILGLDANAVSPMWFSKLSRHAEIGVAVSTSKTVIMLLKGTLTRAPLVRFPGANLTYVRSYRYLGITVSEGMKFLAHIVSLRQRMTGVVGASARVLQVDWGFSPRARRTIYAGLMAPCVLFGASVWCVTVEQVAAKRRLAWSSPA
ncbi:hypothetical protein KR054_007459 [Drosophila jambulina]|nr:hypothetical protein KR054_007459 [Drosophila jambulina]